MGIPFSAQGSVVSIIEGLQNENARLRAELAECRGAHDDMIDTKRHWQYRAEKAEYAIARVRELCDEAPCDWSAVLDGVASTAGVRQEYGRRIKDDSCGNGHMVGQITTIHSSLDAAGTDKFSDQEIVVRSVRPWQVVEEVRLDGDCH